MVSLVDATRVFVEGFAFTRSLTHPYLCSEPVAELWRLHDAPRRSGDVRSEEFVTTRTDPPWLHEQVQQLRGGWYKVCVIVPRGFAEESLRSGFKSLGYRLVTTEELFAHALDRIDPAPDPFEVVRVRTPEAAQRLAKAVGRRQIRPEDLAGDPPRQRQYMALDGETPIGWVGSVRAAGSGWVTNMAVLPEFRRRGIARSLMTRMLLDDVADGFETSILLASHTGSRLYPTVGYQSIGKLLMFSPPPAARRPGSGV